VRSLLLAGAIIAAAGVLSGPPLYSGVAILCGLVFGLPAYFSARQTHALLKLSLTDPLTAIGNRRALEIRLQEESARCARGQHPLSVLMIDVDKLKEINDKAGHRAGDEALRLVGRALRHSTRISDVVGRFGGDEFLVIAPNTSLEEACALGERIAAAARKESAAGASAPPLGLSIGVAYAKSDGPQLETLVKSADAAMYEAKHRGGGRVVAAHDLLLADIVPIRPTAGR
jgi:diguanylate cyclase (GGDEF)-like protein